MIHKKTSEDLRAQNIVFEQQGRLYQVLKFYHATMNLDIIELNANEKVSLQNIPFAHLPKTTKKLIKPN